jgi:hypothetical protein
MRKCTCGKEVKFTGDKCEDCYADNQPNRDIETGVIPYVSGLGEQRPLVTDPPSNPDYLSLFMGGVLAVA